MTSLDIYLMMTLPEIRALCFDLAAICGAATAAYIAFTLASADLTDGWSELRTKLRHIPKLALPIVVLMTVGRLIPDQATAMAMLAWQVGAAVEGAAEIPAALVDAALAALEEYSQSRDN